MKELNLSAEVIYDKVFSSDFKGYSASEVDSFLDQCLEDYQTFEENQKELEDKIVELNQALQEAQNEILELKGKQKAFDLSSTTSYSSVDLLKRISRLEEEVFRK